ncbi:MAG: hypothetical protein CSA03_00485 [Bacteroidetes bacterium]|nr:MAG: hypothetical protein CSA03_00485 [Bacteroidota bacterium]
MKKIIYTLGLLTLPFAFTACFSTSGESSLDKIIASKPSVKYNVIKINDLYSMKVPDFMTVTKELQEDASLQYNNPFKEKYVTVLEEERDEIKTFMNDYGVYDDSKTMLENYVDTRLSYLKESGISVIEETDLKSEMINGRKAYSIEVDASVPGIPEDIAYFFTYIEGQDHFYMISAWTLLSRKDAYSEEVEEMTHSFKEL